MNKLLVLLLLLVTQVLSAQDYYGVSTVFQAYSDGETLDVDNTTVVWKSSDAIIVLNNDFGWEDKIVHTKRGARDYIDIDEDGRLEIVVVDTYLTDSNIEYKFIIVDGTLVIVSTESQIGEPIYFAGYVRSTVTKKPGLKYAYGTASR